MKSGYILLIYSGKSYNKNEINHKLFLNRFNLKNFFNKTTLSSIHTNAYTRILTLSRLEHESALNPVSADDALKFTRAEQGDLAKNDIDNEPTNS